MSGVTPGFGENNSRLAPDSWSANARQDELKAIANISLKLCRERLA